MSERAGAVAQRRSEARFRTLVENLPGAVFRCEAEWPWRFEHVSGAIEAITGYPAADLVPPGALADLSLAVPEDLPAVQEAVRRAVSTGQPYELEYRIRHADGTIRWVHDRGRPVRDASGGPRWIDGVLFDVTARRLAEEAVRENLGRVRAGLEAILLPDGDVGTLELADILDIPQIQALMDRFHDLTAVGVAIIDLHGTVLVATGWRAICSHFHRVHPVTAANCMRSDTVLSAGIEPGTFRLHRCANGMWDVATPITAGGRHLGNLFFGQFFLDGEEPDREAFRSRARQFGFDEGAYLAALDQVPHLATAHVDAVMVFYAKLAELISVLSYRNLSLTRTVSERDALLTSLRASEAKYRSILDYGGIGLGYWSVDGRLQYFNRRAAADMGGPPEEYVGKSIAELYGVEASDVYMERIRAAAISETATEFEDQVRLPNGVRWFLSTYARVVDGSGRAAGVQVISLDITEHKQAERALQAERDRAQQYLDVAGVILVSIAPDGSITLVNRAGCDLLGYTQEELIGRNWFDLVIPEPERDLVRAVFARLMCGETEPMERFENAVVTRGGESRDVSWHNVVLRDASGAIVGTLSSGEDITERKQAERAVQAERDRAQQYLDVAGVILVNVAPDGSITLVNRAGCDLLGYTQEELIGRNWFDVVFREVDRDRIRTMFARVMRGEAEPVDLFESPLVTRNGEERYVSWHNVVLRDASGVSVGMLTSGEDITERKRAEDALRESEERLRLVLQGSNDGWWDRDMEGEGAFFSPRWWEMLGYAEGELPADPGLRRRLTHPDDVERVDRLLNAAYESGQPSYEAEFRLHHKDGHWVPVLSRGFILRDETGRPVRKSGANTDLTERKRIEAEHLDLERRLLHAQKLESLGVLSGGIAHDFNNLLAAVLGNLDVALDDVPRNSPAHTTLEEAMKASRRAIELTRQMLAYSGKGHFAVRPLDLGELLRENVHLFRASVSRTATMNLALETGLPAIMADPGQMQQVVMNLITNASEALGDAAGVITLATGVETCDDAYLRRSRVETPPPAGTYVFVEVTDTGCGMDADTQQRLFDPFFTTKFTGRGLGMAAVLGIVRGHGGAILVDSELSHGTSVKALFPVETAVAGSASARTADGAASAATTAGRQGSAPPLSGTVLLVDDEPVVRDMCRRMLERMGLVVLTAADGAEAVDLFGKHGDEIACVILDLTMPRMDGFAAFQALRRIRPDATVVLSSGYGEESAAERFAGAGLAAFLQKPYTLRVLRRTIEPLLAAGRRTMASRS